ncbi:MAG: hypothetical protein FD174_2487 [Geobacteraceae bacterium]|nr:MAG: hypothetical protein FD174_2487 [Geobacteraceae bacterium]
MILDPTDQFITHITAHCDITDKLILEVGCGRGRITCDLARHARRVVAIDPDEKALQAARSQIPAENVEFLCCGGESLAFPEASFDLVVYSLSLHHLPDEWMLQSLEQAARLLKKGGKMIVIEPGGEGTLIEVEEKFGVGCGNERAAKAAALMAMNSLAEIHPSLPVCFYTLFYFDDTEDFLMNLLPGYQNKPAAYLEEVEAFLEKHRKGERIVLQAERALYIFPEYLGR